MRALIEHVIQGREDLHTGLDDLAFRATRDGRVFVHRSELGSFGDLQRLLNTALAVEDGELVRFGLLLLQEWFAAQHLLKPRLFEATLKDAIQRDRWRNAAALALSRSDLRACPMALDLRPRRADVRNPLSLAETSLGRHRRSVSRFPDGANLWRMELNHQKQPAPAPGLRFVASSCVRSRRNRASSPDSVLGETVSDPMKFEVTPVSSKLWSIVGNVSRERSAVCG